MTHEADEGLSLFYANRLSGRELANRSNISIISVLLTYRCPAACSHCVFESSPSNSATLDVAVARRVIEAASRQNPPPVIGFTGGEPFLRIPVMKELSSFAQSLGMPTEVVSSCVWAKSREYARGVLSDLMDRGLRAYCASIDRYHAPFVDNQSLRNAIQACRDLDLEVRFNAQASNNDGENGAENAIAYIAEALDMSQDYVRSCEVNVLIATPVGRARTDVTDFVYKGKDLREGCPMATEIVTLSPFGFLYPCCGMVVGEKPEDAELFIMDNLRDRSVDEIAVLLQQLKQDLFFKLLQTIGPYRILQELKHRNPGLKTRERYTGACDVCGDFTRNPDVVRATRALLSDLAAKLSRSSSIL